jgi:hypothetical protein
MEQKQNGKILKDLGQEMECPRCSDVMTLSSEFDKLLYFCQECELSLFIEIGIAEGKESSAVPCNQGLSHSCNAHLIINGDMLLEATKDKKKIWQWEIW